MVNDMLRKIDRMHELFGVKAGEKCKDCMHLQGGVNEYRKCDVYGISAASSTDWCLKYSACGLFNEVYSGDVPIVKLNRGGVAKEEIQIDGQMDLFGGQL